MNGFIHFLCFLFYSHCKWFAFAFFIYFSDKDQSYLVIAEFIPKSRVQRLDLEHEWCSLGVPWWPGC